MRGGNTTASVRTQTRVQDLYSDERFPHVDDWRNLAECYDAPLMPEVGAPGSFAVSEPEQRAFIRKYCDKCVVVEECLEASLNIPDQHGVWGGLTEDERRRLRRNRTRRGA